MKWLKAACLLMVVGARAELQFPSLSFIEAISPVLTKCRIITGVSKDLIDEYNSGTINHVDENLKCYMKCIFVRTQVLNENTGEFHYSRMLMKLPEDMRDIASNMGRNCLHFRGTGYSDLCQVSYKLHQCWQQNDPEHYILM